MTATLLDDQKNGPVPGTFPPTQALLKRRQAVAAVTGARTDRLAQPNAVLGPSRVAKMDFEIRSRVGLRAGAGPNRPGTLDPFVLEGLIASYDIRDWADQMLV